MEKIKQLFDQYRQRLQISERRIPETEVKFFVIEFLKEVLPQGKITFETKIGERCADFLIEYDKKSYIIEVKSASYDLKIALKQIIALMRSLTKDSPIAGGIISSFVDWYFIDVNSMQIVNEVNYRELETEKGLKEFLNFLKYGKIIEKTDIPPVSSDSFLKNNIIEKNEEFERSYLEQGNFYVLRAKRIFSEEKELKFDVEGNGLGGVGFGVDSKKQGRWKDIPKCPKHFLFKRKIFEKKGALTEYNGIKTHFWECEKCHALFIVVTESLEYPDKEVPVPYLS